MSNNIRERRADYWTGRSGVQRREAFPNDASRSQPFGTQFRVAAPEEKNGTEKRMVEGYASMVEREYPMWDLFGEYSEVVSKGAFDKTLSRNPDVAYLINHRGVTMARTTNGSLELAADDTGLMTRAWLNPKRSDVNDLLLAIEDKDVTEMSFAFMITEGEWSEEYDQFRIHEVDLNRGDVSAVNYGANPYTSVAARQHEVMADFKRIPRGAQEEALRGAGFVIPAEEKEERSKETVDKGITDPYTLYVEQWLYQHLGK